MPTTVKNGSEVVVTPRSKATISPAVALAKALALVAERETLHAEAEEHESDLVARLTSGDDGVTAVELVQAEAAIRRAGILLEAARRAVPGAERAVELHEAQTNPTLAHWMRDIIEGHAFDFGLFGFPVHVVPELPSKLDTPAVYLFQTEPTRSNAETGIHAGTVKLVVAVPAGVKFRVEQIETGIAEVLDRPGLAKTTVFTIDQGSAHHVNLSMDNVRPLIPTMQEEFDERWIEQFSFDVRDAVAKSGGSIIHNANTAYEITSTRIHATVASRRVVKAEKSGGMLRRIIVVGVNATSKHEVSDLSDKAKNAVESLKGNFVPALGRVEQVHILETNWEDKSLKSSKSNVTINAQFIITARPAI